ncbi:MAG: branched-chain amino acid ABC transporter substrate-binding protein, partial [Candidatus Rokubacteria bacterium]|nr:branched-chain amino acid ABC transporter substrate-binding protein [Candidatus Rokubacteria bacterium]
MESTLRRSRLHVVVGALLIAPLAGCSQADDGDGGDGGDEELALILGTMMPLTGELNNLGPNMQRSAKLAIDQVNAADAGLSIEA